jgi:hypothetical protein
MLVLELFAWMSRLWHCANFTELQRDLPRFQRVWSNVLVVANMGRSANIDMKFHHCEDYSLQRFASALKQLKSAMLGAPTNRPAQLHNAD